MNGTSGADSPPALALLLPLASAMLYVIGALLLRRAADFGVGFWRTTFVANTICAVVYLCLLPLGGDFQPALLWQPAVVALLFMGGSLLNFLSLDKGDVSLATPILGLKIILVAFFTAAILGQLGTPRLWAAAALSTASIALLNWTRTPHHHVTITILAAGASAATFALFDVLVQRWCPAWGVGRFPPTMLGFVAMMGLGTIPRFPAPLKAVDGRAWPWLFSGSVVLAVQSMMFVVAVGHFENATASNVMYASRGLWSVAAVWLIGHWFGNAERSQGAGILRWRLIGAGMMMMAIGLLFW